MLNPATRRTSVLLPTIQQMLKNSAAFLVVSLDISESYAWSLHCSHLLRLTLQESQMTLKIERISEGPKSVVRRSGRLQAEHVDELKAQLEGDWQGIQLDLEGVTLVDVEVV